MPDFPATLTIHTVPAFQAELLALKPVDGETVTLDGKALEAITTPGMQLLLAFEKFLAAKGAKLSVTNPSDAFMQTCLELGMDDYLIKWSL